jgi:hypothetical protein
MSRTVYKYPLDAPSTSVKGHVSLTPLAVAMQGGSPTVWAETFFDGEAHEAGYITHTFTIVPTGGEVPTGSEYVDTFYQDWFVGHVYHKKGN